jgi:hypothetical protein
VPHTITSPNDMRREMQRIAARGAEGNGPDLTSSIVRAALCAGQIEGWSGEDTYTMLAWQLLQAANRWGRIVYDGEVLRPPASVLRIMAPPQTWLAMDIAPKDRVILLRMPELFDVWAPGPWRGGWSHVKQAWTLHLPVAIEGKAGTAELNEGAPQPTGWMEMPHADQT